MNRAEFLQSCGLASMAALTNIQSFAEEAKDWKDGAARLPVVFVGHGNPMNALSDNGYTRSWAGIAAALPKPKAILCVSAHWETKGAYVTAMPKPRTIHDFGGFPRELNEFEYRAPGDPELARAIRDQITQTTITLDHQWGLDHGTWAVLTKMYPQADVPVLQLSLHRTRDLTFHYELGRSLQILREKGVLIVGSGNIVHNIGAARFGEVEPYDWAVDFDRQVTKWIQDGNHRSLVDYQSLGQMAKLAHPTNEHYLPLLYILGLQQRNDKVSFPTTGIDFGSASMRSVLFS